MDKIIEKDAVDKVAEPVVEYQTKSIPAEVAAGRVTKFVSPEGREYTIRTERVERFKRLNGVDDKWIVS